MAVPVISATSSILGFRRLEQFAFQPSATNLPVRWTATGLPAGVTVDSPAEIAVTGVHSTDVITATAHGYAAGTRVWFPALTGGTGLNTTTIYFVRDVTTDTFKLATVAGGLAVDFSSDISAGAVCKVSSGTIAGSVAVAGVYVFGLTATNTAAEVSAVREFVIGILPETAPSEGLATAAAEWSVDVIDRAVRISAGASAPEGGLAVWKYDDILLVAIRFDKGGTPANFTVDTLRLVLKKELDGAVLVEADEFETVVDSAGNNVHVLKVDVTGNSLLGEIDDSFLAFAEIEWTQSTTFDEDPLTLRLTSQTFRLTLEADLADN